MINNINPYSYTPSSYTPQASAVSINIFNPQAFSSPAANPNYNWNTLPTPQYAPINTPIYYTPNSNPQPVSNNQVTPEQLSNSQTQAPQNNQPYVAPTGEKEVEGIDNNANLKSDLNVSQKDGDDKKEVSDKKKKVALTNDYIKNLENYLNSQDPKVRLMGAKELLERFKEDESRASDKALNALLNKTIQDPNNTVKFVGLTILDSGYSKGNKETVQILKNIQQDTSAQYGEDSLLASQILLKMSAQEAS